jgi:CBS domain-containing protein
MQTYTWIGFLSLKTLMMVCVVIELMSDTSLHEAIQTLAKNRILSAPVRDVNAQQDASWMDKYLGVIEFAGITHWVLHQVYLSISLRIVSGTFTRFRFTWCILIRNLIYHLPISIYLTIYMCMHMCMCVF